MIDERIRTVLRRSVPDRLAPKGCPMVILDDVWRNQDVTPFLGMFSDRFRRVVKPVPARNSRRRLKMPT